MTKAKKRDDEDADEGGDDGAESGDMETRPKRTTSFVARLTHKKHVVSTRLFVHDESWRLAGKLKQYVVCLYEYC
jgi:hypothetical protein